MPELKGEARPTLPWNALVKVGDLLYLEDHGPLYSVFVDENFSQPIIYIWVDYADANLHRWLVFPTSSTWLCDYMSGVLPDLGFIRRIYEGKEYYTADIRVKFEGGGVVIETQNVLKVRLEDLPPSYLPDLDVFYEGCEDEAKIADYFNLEINKRPLKVLLK